MVLGMVGAVVPGVDVKVVLDRLVGGLLVLELEAVVALWGAELVQPANVGRATASVNTVVVTRRIHLGISE